RNHIYPRLIQLRGHHFDRNAIQKNPRHVRKCASNERQVECVPAIELDEKMRLPSASPLPQRTEHGSEPGDFLLIGCHRRYRSQDPTNGRGFGDHNILRQRGQHLRQQRRTTARHVEDESTRLQTRPSSLPFDQNFERSLMTKEETKRLAQTLFDRLPEEWFNEASRADTAPVDQWLDSVSPCQLWGHRAPI